MSEHAQAASTVRDAEHWRDVVNTLVSRGVDPDLITPEWVTAIVQSCLRLSSAYNAEYAGWRCYEDVYR